MKTSINFIHWLPRILCILAICFISIFAFDAFEPGRTIWQQLGAFIIHLAPSFILIVFLIIAWKWELIGGIAFTIIGIVMSPLLFQFNRNVNHFAVEESLNIILIITFPFIVIGALFIVSYFKRKKYLQQSHT